MRLKFTNIFTGLERICEATLTTEHALSSYGLPVLLVEGEPWSAADVLVNAPIVILSSNSAEEKDMLIRWWANVLQQAGGDNLPASVSFS